MESVVSEERGKYSTYHSWRDALRKKHGPGNIEIEGDKDIAQAWVRRDGKKHHAGEWDGADGYLQENAGDPVAPNPATSDSPQQGSDSPMSYTNSNPGSMDDSGQQLLDQLEAIAIGAAELYESLVDTQSVPTWATDQVGTAYYAISSLHDAVNPAQDQNTDGTPQVKDATSSPKPSAFKESTIQKALEKALAEIDPTGIGKTREEFYSRHIQSQLSRSSVPEPDYANNPFAGTEGERIVRKPTKVSPEIMSAMRPFMKPTLRRESIEKAIVLAEAKKGRKAKKQPKPLVSTQKRGKSFRELRDAHNSKYGEDPSRRQTGSRQFSWKRG
jgi:hypothetical protein